MILSLFFNAEDAEERREDKKKPFVRKKTGTLVVQKSEVLIRSARQRERPDVVGRGRRALWIERLGLNRRDATVYGDWFGSPRKDACRPSWAALWGLLLTPCFDERCSKAAATRRASLVSCA